MGTNHASLQNGTGFAAGKVGTAFSLDGVNDYVSIPASVSLDVGAGNGMTIEGWINPNDVGSPHALWEWNNGAGILGPHIWFSIPEYGGPRSIFANLVDTAGQDHFVASSPGVVVAGSYQHLAITYTKSTGVAKIYYNGSAVANTTVGVFSLRTSAGLYLGTRPGAGPGAGSYFSGLMDEVSLYGRALSDAEIQAIYNANSLGKCACAGPPVIVIQPTNRTVVVGNSAAFSVGVATCTASYQWQLNSNNIPGATNATFSLSNVQLTNAGVYAVVVSNAYGWVTSSNAVLTVATSCVSAAPGLVGWWAAEGNANDAGGGNNGVASGGVKYVAGMVGQAFDFDGTTGDVVIPAAADLAFASLTVETWIRAADLGNPQPIVEYGNATGFCSMNLWHGIGPGIISLPGSISGFFRDPGGAEMGVVSAGGLLQSNQWSHVALTYDASTFTARLYHNGVNVGAATSSVPVRPNGLLNVNLGYRPVGSADLFGGRRLLGSLDEASIYNRALTDSEIQGIYAAGSAGKCSTPTSPFIFSQPANQIVSVGSTATFSVAAGGTFPLSYRWRFNGSPLTDATNATVTLTNVGTNQAGAYAVTVTNLYGSVISSNAVLTVNPVPPCTTPPSGLVSWWRGESNALDSIGPNTGVLGGNTTFGPGRVGQGFVFDGIGDVVTLGNPSNLQLQDLTIEAWIKRGSTSVVTYGSFGNGIIFGYGSGGYGLYLDPNGTPALSKVGSSATSPATTITDTNLHHLAVTKSGSTVIFFIDGTAYSAAAYNPGFAFSTVAAIGARGDNLDNSFLGMIDEVAIYNRALATNEIQAIYHAGLSGKCVVPVAPVIISQPQNTNAIAGNNVTFRVVAGGSVPFNYQWRFKGTNIAAATNAILSLTNVQLNQAGSYSVQVTNSAGSALSSNATLSVAFPTAVIRVGATNIMAGRPVTVPVTLAANGIENGLGFSLNFNTQRLVFLSATLGSGAAGATMLVNTSLIATGRVGIVVAFPPQLTFAAGTQQVVRVNFNSLPLLGVSSVNATNSFADQPVLRELYAGQLQTLPANYSNGIVTLAPTVFEADVFPRPNGNQAVTSTDWAQAGRFAARLDAAAAGAEFQRADSAPRATLGDGQMKVTDWVQAGRYLAGLDPLVAIGGPTNETVTGTVSSPGSRQLSLANTNVLQEQSAMVSVFLEAQGDENALGFTLTFNPTAFVFADVTLGSGAAGASLIPNTSQVGAGRLGVVLALPTGSRFSAGSREMVQVNLVASPDVAGPFPVTLSDQLVTRCASDAFANELPVNYANGTLTVNPVNPNPTLAITQSSTNVVLSWPLWAADFTLQTLEGTNGLQGSWTNTLTTLQTNGSMVFVTLPIAIESKFFRLFHP